jgi:hypothetical protein
MIFLTIDGGGGMGSFLRDRIDTLLCVMVKKTDGYSLMVCSSSGANVCDSTPQQDTIRF